MTDRIAELRNTLFDKTGYVSAAKDAALAKALAKVKEGSTSFDDLLQLADLFEYHEMHD
jgi:hypothetical protein